MAEEICFLCSRRISREPGSRSVEATLGRDKGLRVFHLDCFDAFTTGSRKELIWTYCVRVMEPWSSS